MLYLSAACSTSSLNLFDSHPFEISPVSKFSTSTLIYGFLRNLFEVFERYKTPIDMITTSEVAVSVTIDELTNLEGIVKELKNFGSVEVDENQTIVCIVGDYSAEGIGYASKIFTALDKIPIRMISYGGSNHNVSVLIQTDQKIAALSALSKGVFNL